MHEQQSYCIWFTPRTGSTLLCKALESTGIAGKAGEFLNHEGTSLLEYYKAENYEDLKTKLWELGTSKNGVMGIKYSLYKTQQDAIAKELNTLRNLGNTNPLDWQILADLLPNCKHIYLTRRNTLRQVVSWWKAIQDEQWHRERKVGKKQNPEFYKDKYNFDALLHLFKENRLREAAMQSYFSFNKITPLTIVYEDFIHDYEKTIKQILNYLGLEKENVELGEKYYERTADEINELWVQRFRVDLQQDWERKMW